MNFSDIPHLYDCFLKTGQKISTDTRKDVRGTLFFCLSGARFNGNLYAQLALDNGASFVVTNSSNINDERIILFENPNQTLIELAHFHTQQIPTKLIAIGGSNGKTTTKEWVQSVLGTTYKTRSTPGNFNNDIGVPLTLLSFTPDTEYGIVELGTNHPGEMKVLCAMFKADSALITNIGKEHLEGFSDLESVAQEESELYLMALRDEAMAFVNFDDPWLNNMSKRLKQLRTYSLMDRSCSVFIDVSVEMPYLKSSLYVDAEPNGILHAQLGGKFNAYNLAAAVSVGLHYGVSVENIAKGIAAYTPNMNRSQWIMSKNGTQILLDAYNANPSSMESGIRSFATLEGKKTLLLGDMLELGTHSSYEHLAIFQLTQELGYSDVYFVGDEFKKALPSYPFVFDTASSLMAWLDTHALDSQYVYIKGSRGIAMEQCLDYFDLS
jgi:UDP-N-acetylmuramoyl-tripeptide--D-alanyl-D-alanine ligase